MKVLLNGEAAEFVDGRDGQDRAGLARPARGRVVAWRSPSTPRSSRAASGTRRNCTRGRGWRSCARSREAEMAVTDTNTDVLTIAGTELRSRLLLGTGGFRSLDALAAALEVSGSRAGHRRAAPHRPVLARLDRRRARPRGRQAAAQHRRVLHRARRGADGQARPRGVRDRLGQARGRGRRAHAAARRRRRCWRPPRSSSTTASSSCRTRTTTRSSPAGWRTSAAPR